MAMDEWERCPCGICVLVSIHREAQGLRLGSATVHRKPGRRERQGRPRQPANLEGDHAAEHEALGAAGDLEGAAEDLAKDARGAAADARAPAGGP